MAAGTKAVQAAASSVESTAEDLPVASLRAAAPHLRRPFTPEAVKFKVQTVFSGASGCLVVAYIDARLVIERLNKVIPDKWEPRFEKVPDSKLMWCFLTVDGMTRCDVGESPKGYSKDLVSDALKRAAVHFGVGVSTYALPQITLNAGSPHVEKRTKPKETLVLTEVGHRKLREGYARWLEEHGTARFGAPLDHGDVEGATFDEDDPVEEFAPELPPALDDERAQELVAACRSAYDALREAGGQKEVPPAKFSAWLAGASHSHEELERLRAHLESRAAEIASAS